MSKLKVHKIGDLCFDFKMGKDVGIDFYLKSNVDTVIEEKDRAIEFAKAITLKDIEIIKEKDKEIAELKDKLRWRKFPDEKPKWGEEVIVLDDASKQYIVRFSYDMKWISWGNMNTCESKYVKYWMPLPSYPNEVK